LTWKNLEKILMGRLNKLNKSNLPSIIRDLFQYNIIRGRGLLVRGIIEAQTASTLDTPVYAALVAVINSKIP
jgi:pre-mRNA-splicing factor CWC22